MEAFSFPHLNGLAKLPRRRLAIAAARAAVNHALPKTADPASSAHAPVFSPEPVYGHTPIPSWSPPEWADLWTPRHDVDVGPMRAGAGGRGPD